MIVLKIFDKLSLVISSTKITANTPKAQNNKWNDSLLMFHILNTNLSEPYIATFLVNILKLY